MFKTSFPPLSIPSPTQKMKSDLLPFMKEYCLHVCPQTPCLNYHVKGHLNIGKPSRGFPFHLLLLQLLAYPPFHLPCSFMSSGEPQLLLCCNPSPCPLSSPASMADSAIKFLVGDQVFLKVPVCGS